MDFVNEEVVVEVYVLRAAAGALGVGHDDGCLIVDFDVEGVCVGLVGGEMEGEGGIGGGAEWDSPFGGKLAEPLKVTGGARSRDEFDLGGGKGMCELFGAAPMEGVVKKRCGYAGARVARFGAREKVGIDPGLEVEGRGGRGSGVGDAEVWMRVQAVSEVFQGVKVSGGGVFGVCGELRVTSAISYPIVLAMKRATPRASW